MVWSSVFQRGKEIFPKTLRYPKLSGLVIAYREIHRPNKRSVKKVQGAFILVVVHIGHIDL